MIVAASLCVAILAWDITSDHPWPTPHPYVMTPHKALVGFGAVVGAGDFDGDGFGDLAIGAPGASDRFEGEGWVGVYRGGVDGLSPRPSFEAWGGAPGASFGAALAAGDFDGDGFAELVVGAPLDSRVAAEGGRVSVFFGSAGGIAVERPAWTYEGRVDGQRLGFAVAHAGDFDADGFGELAVGSLLGGGQVELFFGQGGGLPTQSRLVVAPSWRDEEAPIAVRGVGDVDRDGHGDFVVLGEGRATLYFGGAERAITRAHDIAGAEVVGVGDLDGDGASDVMVIEDGRLVFWGDEDGWAAELGALSPSGFRAVSPAGDMNGDGYADFAAHFVSGDGARVVFLSGRPGGARAVGSWPSNPAGIAAAGDVDGDGFGDVALVEPALGRVVVVRGRAAGLSTEPVALPVRQPGIPSWWPRIEGLLDVDGDGFDDLAVATADYEPPHMGRVVVLAGGRAPFSSMLLALTSENPGDRLGSSIAGAIDINGDGYADLILGASGYDDGRLELWYGSPAGLVRSLAHTLPWSFEGVSSLSGEGAIGANALGVGDTNGDGLSDVSFDVRTHFASRRAHMLLGNEVVPRLGARVGNIREKLGESLGRGDFDGDGFADLVISGNKAHLDLIFGSTGNRWVDRLPTTSAEEPRGFAVSGLGDVDGDGRDDIGVTAWPNCVDVAPLRVLRGGYPFLLERQQRFEPTPRDECLSAGIIALGDLDGDGFGDMGVTGGRATPRARVAVHAGSPSGIGASPRWEVSGTLPNSLWMVGGRSAGDFDGDGYPDFVFGRQWSGAGDTEPIAYLVRGNGGHGTSAAWPARAVAREPDDFAPIVPGHRSTKRDSFAVAAHMKSPFGRQRMWLEVEVKPIAVPFDGLGLVRSASFDVDREPRRALVRVEGLLAQTAYKWRARVRHDPSQWAPQGASAWRYGGPLGQRHGVHVRTHANQAPTPKDDVYVVETGGVLVAGVATSVLVNDTDPEHDPLTTAIRSMPSRGELTMTPAGGFVYRPEPGFIGNDRFVYEARDRFGGVGLAAVTITVSPLAACGVATEAQCDAGDFFVHLRMADGAIRSLRCRVGQDGEPSCDVEDGVATLAWPICR